MCRKALTGCVVSLRTTVSIPWNFTWTIPTISFAQSHYRSMQRFFITESRKVGGDLSVKLALFPGSRADLEWQLSNQKYQTGKIPFPNIEIFSDTSLSGWGVAVQRLARGVRTGRPLSITLSSLGPYLRYNHLQEKPRVFPFKSEQSVIQAIGS